MPNIRYIKKPFLERIISAVFIFASIILLSGEQKAFGIVTLIIGLGLLISNSVCTGIEINTEQKYYRKLYSFLGIVFGEWESFPKTEYISVYKSRETLNSPAANWPTLTSNSYIVNSFGKTEGLLHYISPIPKRSSCCCQRYGRRPCH